ncbi:hypothetical protein [Cellulomonas sp. PhB143]|uniref:PIN-like domain-containing protein n=1 Tax=Cellulomonas sp. PhB143 TaxID=2485186 RepID=UPI000F487038|nr:hypothetical protein [Cellulomonas sp. PhB143]ROS72049.1 hypothetical protein EDF32_2791 [Cellulomonas sp. PhB143]
MAGDSAARFFVDRGMGARLVPDGLRAAGWQLTTMTERYGIKVSEGLADVDWIREASERGEAILTKDARIARVPVEAAVVVNCDAKVFAMTSSRITGPEMLARLLHNQMAIHRWAQRTPPPFVAGVDASRIARLKLARLEV